MFAPTHDAILNNEWLLGSKIEFRSLTLFSCGSNGEGEESFATVDVLCNSMLDNLELAPALSQI